MGRDLRAKLEISLRAALGAVLLFAGLQKLNDPASFAEQVANYQWMPGASIWVATLLPPVEIVAAVALWLLPPAWRQAAALLATLLFVTFTAAVTRALWLDINIDCGCFGTESGAIGTWTVVRNSALTLAGLAAIWLSGGLAVTRDGANPQQSGRQDAEDR